MRGSHRELALRNMATALLIHGEIQTTRARARHISALVNHLIAVAQNPGTPTFNKYREIRRYVQDRRAVSRIFALATADPDRRGSFVRRFLTGYRQGDAAPLAVLRLIESQEKRQKEAIVEPASAREEKPKRGRFLGLGSKKKTSPSTTKPKEKKSE